MPVHILCGRGGYGNNQNKIYVPWGWPIFIPISPKFEDKLVHVSVHFVAERHSVWVEPECFIQLAMGTRHVVLAMVLVGNTVSAWLLPGLV